MIRWIKLGWNDSMTFHDDEHKINNTGWIWNGDETEGWNEAKPKGNAERFSIYIFSIRREANSWNLHLQKLRGLCKYLANVYNSHSHVYGLHRPICTQKTRQKINAMRRVVLWKSSALSRHKIWRSLLAILNSLHCRQNHNLFMKRNERENKKNKENAVRLIVHSITHRGERWRGGGGAAPLYQLINGMRWYDNA